MTKKNDNLEFVDWFRQSSPYIHAHRGSTFVLAFGGEAVSDASFANLIHDIALLQGLGIRLILVHGARPQIEKRLKKTGAVLRIVNNLRITDDKALDCVKEATATTRVEIEALLSMGLANSPMAGACIRVASGNFITAKPLGVIDGTDYGHTGSVRRVDTEGIRHRLDDGNIVLISPLGYSPTGEVFNLKASDVARSIATHLGADKLIMLTEEKVADSRGRLIESMTPGSIDALLEGRRKLSEQQRGVLENAAIACRRGVNRVHLLSRHLDGALLKELFTRDGAGTLVSTAPYEITRPATIDDVGGILELITPLESKGILVQRPREVLENEVEQFVVVERDGTVIACAACYPSVASGKTSAASIAELACVAVHQDYQNQGRGDALLLHMETEAKKSGISSLFVLTTRSAHWFRERGFKPATVKQLPGKKRALYNWQRNAKVFIKTL